MKKTLSMRRTGDSTRYIDDCIQTLFLYLRAHVDRGHLDRVLRRLDMEHRISHEDIKRQKAGTRYIIISLVRCPHCGSKLDPKGEGPTRHTCHTCGNGAVWCIRCGRVVVNTPEGWHCIDESCR